MGPGLDTRAARVDWPRGTLVMELVPAAAAAATGEALTAPAHAQGSYAPHEWQRFEAAAIREHQRGLNELSRAANNAAH